MSHKILTIAALAAALAACSDRTPVSTPDGSSSDAVIS